MCAIRKHDFENSLCGAATRPRRQLQAMKNLRLRRPCPKRNVDIRATRSTCSFGGIATLQADKATSWPHDWSPNNVAWDDLAARACSEGGSSLRIPIRQPCFATPGRIGPAWHGCLQPRTCFSRAAPLTLTPLPHTSPTLTSLTLISPCTPARDLASGADLQSGCSAHARWCGAAIVIYAQGA